MTSTEPLNPSVSLLCKMGSLAVHVDEGMSADGHHLDVAAVRGILVDPEVQTWLRGMEDLSLIPVMRRNDHV